ncbi:MAG: hypothetical protein QGG64_01950 [Candidatus Latescibacteria bacterium]|jgi:hypothetical protein|nr:hypothetical protein [Candidatus Latescibacterota bacterium]
MEWILTASLLTACGLGMAIPGLWSHLNNKEETSVDRVADLAKAQEEILIQMKKMADDMIKLANQSDKAES